MVLLWSCIAVIFYWFVMKAMHRQQVVLIHMRQSYQPASTLHTSSIRRALISLVLRKITMILILLDSPNVLRVNHSLKMIMFSAHQMCICNDTETNTVIHAHVCSRTWLRSSSITYISYAFQLYIVVLLRHNTHYETIEWWFHWWCVCLRPDLPGPNCKKTNSQRQIMPSHANMEQSWMVSHSFGPYCLKLLWIVRSLLGKWETRYDSHSGYILAFFWDAKAPWSVTSRTTSLSLRALWIEMMTASSSYPLILFWVNSTIILHKYLISGFW